MSKEISFSVSAKAARLIGRENITDVSGALTELVKNSYDADAESVLINYDIPFPIIEEGQDISENINVLSSRDFEFLKNEQCIKIENSTIKINFFHDKESEIDSDEENKKPKLEEGAETDSDEKNKKPNLEIIKEILSKYNHIYIIDDGTGMTGEILSTVWMIIGTSDKEKNTTSKKVGRKQEQRGLEGLLLISYLLLLKSILVKKMILYIDGV